MKNTMKIINILLVVVMALVALSTTVSADASTLIDTMKPDYSDSSGIATTGKKIVNIIATVGVVVSVVVLTILGIKYMIGSASEKAEYKKTMIPYLVGALLVFGASAIAQVVVKTATGLVS